MKIKKTFHCTFCGHEIKAEVCPEKCSCCGRSRFFIDLESYNELKSKCNETSHSRVRGSLGSKNKASLEKIKLQDSIIQKMENENQHLKEKSYKIFAALLILNIITIVIIFI